MPPCEHEEILGLIFRLFPGDVPVRLDYRTELPHSSCDLRDLSSRWLFAFDRRAFVASPHVQVGREPHLEWIARHAEPVSEPTNAMPNAAVFLQTCPKTAQSRFLSTFSVSQRAVCYSNLLAWLAYTTSCATHTQRLDLLGPHAKECSYVTVHKLIDRCSSSKV